MSKFRSVPKVVDAIQYKPHLIEEMDEFLRTHLPECITMFIGNDMDLSHNSKTVAYLFVNDYLIVSNGNITVLSEEDFKREYEPIKEASKLD